MTESFNTGDLVKVSISHSHKMVGLIVDIIHSAPQFQVPTYVVYDTSTNRKAHALDNQLELVSASE